MSTAKKILNLDGPFNMRCGGVLQSPIIVYETWGELEGRGENAILLFTGLSPSAHATSSLEDPSPGWWEDMVGPGRPIDTNRYFVICVNSLGSCFGSTGPASINPETGEVHVDKNQNTSVEGIYAAGDLTDATEPKQTVTAASQGAVAALSAYQHVMEVKSAWQEASLAETVGASGD